MNKYQTYKYQYIMQREGIMDGNSGCIRGGWFDLDNNNLYETIIQPYENPINPEEPIFYYHSDHLGSASFLTDRDGYETQQLVYLPFGEDWVDMKYNTSQFETPYKFNGKEKDEETGLHYYGARYLNTDLSIWLSVDPMSDKYPHLTPYAYCAGNPIMLVDPDGRKIWIVGSDEQTFVEYKTNEKNQGNSGEIVNEIFNSGEEGKKVVEKLSTADEDYYIMPEGFRPNSDKQEAAGMVLPTKNNPNKFIVEWGTPNEDNGGSSRNTLAEELYHCFQMYDNNGKFINSKGFSVDDEVKAKEFSAQTFSNYEKYYQHKSGGYITTEMNIMGNSGLDKDYKARYLQGNMMLDIYNDKRGMHANGLQARSSKKY